MVLDQDAIDNLVNTTDLTSGDKLVVAKTVYLKLKDLYKELYGHVPSGLFLFELLDKINKNSYKLSSFKKKSFDVLYRGYTK